MENKEESKREEQAKKDKKYRREKEKLEERGEDVRRRVIRGRKIAYGDKREKTKRNERRSGG